MSNVASNSPSWTAEQAELINVDAHGQPVLVQVAVTADAGSGKTSVLVARAKAIIEKRPDDRILCVSFTEKSAADLKSRLTLYEQIEVYTIHGFCARILREFGSHVGLPPLWNVLDERASVDLLYRSFEMIYRLAPPLNDDFSSDQWFSLTRAVLSATHKQSLPLEFNQPEALRFCNAVLDHYEQSKQKANGLEYGDLEVLAAKLVSLPEVRAILRSRYAHVFVDEFQDTSAVQCALVRALVGNKQSLFVVGDSKQSIYRFRGADVSVFEEFIKTLPATKRLSKNFRSSPEVIDHINQACASYVNEYQPMVAGRGAESPPAAYALGAHSIRLESNQDPALSARLICEAIKKLSDSGVPTNQVTLLLSRIRNPKVQALLAHIQQSGIAVALSSAGGVLTNPALISLMKLWVWALEPWQKLSAAESFVRFQGQRSELKNQLADFLPQSELLSPTDLLDSLNARFNLSAEFGVYYEQFRLYILSEQEAGVSAGSIARNITRLWAEGADIGGLNILPPPDSLASTLKVLTVHGSKGLEFPVVILADLNGKSPNHTAPFIIKGNHVYVSTRGDDGKLQRSDAEKEAIAADKQAAVEELARLFYVATTRAEHALVYIDDSPIVDVDALQKKTTRAPTWADVAKLAIPTATEWDVTSTKDAVINKNAYIQSVDPIVQPLPSVEYHLARTGVTAYINRAKTEDEKNSVRSGHGPRLSVNLKGMPAHVFGERAHAYLEHQDFEGLKNFTVEHSLDLSAFYSWLRTKEGRCCFSPDPQDQALRYPEFAFDWVKDETVTLTGRMDLLLLWPKQKTAWVIDFKVLTSIRSADALRQEYAAQLELYAQAVRALTGYTDIQTYVIDVTASTGSVWHCF